MKIHIAGELFPFTPTGFEYGVEGFAATPFSLIATTGFFPVQRVTSLFRALATSGSILTDTVGRWPEGTSFSKAY